MASHVPELPVELWDMILRLACTPEKEPRVGRLQTRVAPITVSQLRRGWRHFAITNPEFWTHVSYVFSYIAYTPRPGPRLMHVFLERSMDLPLTVNLDIEEHCPETRPDAHEFLVAVFANLRRWQSAKLFISLKDVAFKTWEDLGAVIYDAPLLESLEMTIEPVEPKVSWQNWPTLLWQDAPKLTKLAICLEEMKPTDEHQEFFEYGDPEETISNWALRSGIPYEQLIHLLLDAGPNGDLTWREIASIFQRAQNLISCSFRGINSHRGLPDIFHLPLYLQHLQHLDLCGPYDDSNNGTLMTSMNEVVIAPFLKSLSLLHSDDTWDTDAYEGFIEHAGFELTHLHLGLSPQDTPSNLLDCIRLSPPTLLSLHTTHLGVLSPEFTEQMGEWDEETGKFELCPILEQIAINVSVPSSFPDPFKGMADMLKKRLCPPDGSSGSFKKLIVSPGLGNKLVDLDDLLAEPYGLRIEYGFVYPEARAMFDIGLSS